MKKSCDDMCTKYERWLFITKTLMITLMLVMVVGTIIIFTLCMCINLGKINAEVLQIFVKIWIAVELLVVVFGSIAIATCEGYKKKCDDI